MKEADEAPKSSSKPLCSAHLEKVGSNAIKELREGPGRQRGRGQGDSGAGKPGLGKLNPRLPGAWSSQSDPIRRAGRGGLAYRLPQQPGGSGGQEDSIRNARLLVALIKAQPGV